MGARDGLFAPFDGSQGTSPTDARIALGALLATDGASSQDVRPGILWAPGNDTGAASAEPGRVTGTSSTSPWRYQIRAAHLVGVRSAAVGPHLFTLEGTTFADTIPAPASGARWDLIWARQRDFGLGDGVTVAEAGVTSGDAAPSNPVRPSPPAGAVVLSEALVSSTATSTSHAGVTISPVAKFTAPRGCPIPVRSQAERDAITRYPGLQVMRLDLAGRLERYVAGIGWEDYGGYAFGAWEAISGAYDGAGCTWERKNGMVTVGINIARTDAGATNSSHTLGTLPVQARPRLQYLDLVMKAGATPYLVTVSTAGAVSVTAVTITNGQRLQGSVTFPGGLV